jgi:DNA-binding response OmpR family regulator
VAKLKKTVLIVDDEASSRTLLREILVEGGYDVLEAADGLMALGLLEKRAVSLLITDRSMPGLGGLELLTKLREKQIMVPTLMVSAYGEESFWGQAIGLGAVDYLLKPFKPEDLLKSVKKHYARPKGHDPFWNIRLARRHRRRIHL